MVCLFEQFRTQVVVSRAVDVVERCTHTNIHIYDQVEKLEQVLFSLQTERHREAGSEAGRDRNPGKKGDNLTGIGNNRPYWSTFTHKYEYKSDINTQRAPFKAPLNILG